jgi:methionyl-tRNA synthetase
MTEKFYITTPIYYVNARPHIGTAYTTIACDTIARRHRMLGHDTWFLTGTDEHGQKIERSAAAAGIPPQQFTDEVSAEFRNLWARMGLTNDDFIRTTEPRHQQGAQRLFALLHQRGQIYLSSYTGQYSIGEEIFVEGPPGVLGPDGKPTETVTEENFFFRLSEYQLPLLDLIESDTLLIQPESRKNEVLSFLRGPIAEAQRNAAAQPAPTSIQEAVTDQTATAQNRTTADKEVVILNEVKDPCILPLLVLNPLIRANMRSAVSS